MITNLLSVDSDFYRPHTEYDGKVMFSVFLSIHRGGGLGPVPSLVSGGGQGGEAPNIHGHFRKKKSLFFFVWQKIIFRDFFLAPEVNPDVNPEVGTRAVRLLRSCRRIVLYILFLILTGLEQVDSKSQWALSTTRVGPTRVYSVPCSRG